MPTLESPYDVPIDDRVYPPFKLATCVQKLGQQNVGAADVLNGTGISAETLLSPATRISRRQLITALSNIVELTDDPAIGLRLGSSMRVTDYGMYGFALLSSRNLQSALEFSCKYHRLAAPTAHMDLDVDSASMVFLHDPEAAALHQFVIEFQLGVVTALLRDIMGDSFKPTIIRADYPEPEYSEVYAKIFDCEIQFNCPEASLQFDSEWLEKPLLRANPISAQMALELCEKELTDMAVSDGIAKRVYRLLISEPGEFPGPTEIAERMHLAPRTLRRKLESQGTSYQAILLDVKRNLATDYLTGTDISVDEIAERVGFGDPANFRHAFKRWTGKTPAAYRRKS